jgi:hypothetical protein
MGLDGQVRRKFFNPSPNHNPQGHPHAQAQAQTQLNEFRAIPFLCKKNMLFDVNLEYFFIFEVVKGTVQ